MAEVMRPQEWCKLKGFRVLDPDGWNHYRRTWFEPVTEKEFDEMIARSTVERIHG